MIHKTTRSILSVLLAALLLVTSTPLTPAFAGEEGVVSLQSESGESEGLKQVDGEYQIYTADDLKEFADIVNGTAEGIDQNTSANAKLMNNIVLNEKIEVDDNGAVTNQEKLSEWIPIGTDINPYRGTFNGDGHTISGLYIKNSSSDNYQGLFGYVSGNGKIENLSVSGSVSGNNYVGGIVGYNFSGTVTNCAFSGSGSVSGSDHVGGVVGYNGASVTNCYNTGEVSGSEFVGGVVGSNSFSATVTNCYNTGTVTGPDSVNDETTVNVGGVVGQNFGGTVENCYNTGTVIGPDSGSGNRVGGVVGNNEGGSVTNCYNTGKVSGNRYVGGVVGYNLISSTVENCYNIGSVNVSGNSSVVGGVVGYNNGLVKNCYNTGTVTVTGTDDYVGGVVGYNDVGGSVAGCYNTGSVSGNQVGGVVGLNSFSATVTGCYFLQQDPAIYGIGNDNTHTGAAVVNDLDALCEELKNDNTNTWSISPFYDHPVLKTNPEGGDGTAAHPYEIKTADELETFRDIVNGASGQVKDSDAHAKLMNDIDLSSVCGPTLDSEQPVSWTPIGNSESTAYTGTFNGNGKTIKNLYINNTTSDTDYQGLFGYVGSSGKVQNLSVSGTVNSSYVGGVVGLNSGNVENCYNTGTVTGTVNVSGNSSVVGGVVGYNNGSVTNCYNTGEVSGKISVGGVVGYNNSGTVKNCYNTGNVSGGSKGGVVGYNISSGTSAIVENCYYQIDKGATFGIGGTTKDDISQTAAKSFDDFQSGEVAYLLQSKQPAAEDGTIPQVWGQTLGGEEDSLPTLVALNPGAAQPVYKVTFKYGYDSAPENEISYTNGSVKFPADSEIPSYEGYTLTGWQDEDENAVTEPITVTADTTFTAQWQKDTVNYTVTVSADPEAGGTVNGGGTFAEGTQVTVTATANDGYTFGAWQEGGTKIENAGTSYTFTVNGNRSLTAVFEKDEDPDPTPTPTPTPSGPSTGDSTGWDDILDELENTAKGEQITIDMGDETKVPAEIFESVAGKDVDVTFDLGDDLSWTVNGKDIPDDAALADLDLGVALDTDGIPANVINTITGEVGTVQITLAHDGEFGFTMTLTAPLGKENAGYWANLYHYKVNGGEADREDPLGDDERAEALNFEAAAKIDEDGSVKIPFSHASQYAIVIDDHSHAAVDVSDIFLDVTPNAWYKDAVQYAYDNGLMTGVSDTEFAPEATTTRAMIVSILARLENVTTAEAAGFADVDDNDWYATAVNWAANVGVVNGYEDNTFQPNTAITREQLAAMLMNYAACIGQDVSNRADLANYTDQPSTWAEEAMQWAVAEGLISGVTNDQLQPQSSATRAQVAAILQRLLEA